MEIPETIEDAVVLRYARVTEDVRPTGKTRHLRATRFVGNEPLAGVVLPPATALAIAQYRNEGGYYLFGLDRHGSVQSDTWHESIEDALSQAEFEYEGLVWTAPSL